MATKRELKREKRHAKGQRRRTKNGSPAFLRLTLKIGRLNKRIARKNRLSAAELLVRRYLEEAHRCTTLGLSYVWGGSHGSSPTPHNGPWDCSSYASHLDQTVLQNVPTMTTFSMEDESKKGKDSPIQPGPGEHITHHICNSPPSDAHVITSIRFRGKTYWTECGGSDNTKPGDGPCFFNPPASRVAHFPIKCHPRGL